MCTVTLLRRPDHKWPLIIGANRDEMKNRPWKTPARHWSDRPEVVAGLDCLGEGTWLGINDQGVVAAILNRTNSLGPAAGKRSRGELVLDALDFNDAVDAAEALSQLNPDAFRPFNLLIADNKDAFWLAHREDQGISVMLVPEGLSMLSERELSDRTSPRINRYLPLFAAATPPRPEAGDWSDWQKLLQDRTPDPNFDDASALAFDRPNGFGTICHSILALPSADQEDSSKWWLFADASETNGWFSVLGEPEDGRVIVEGN